ncbi:MAG: hypothetical protein WEE64_04685 [Dehalococcoidia bacterium]
MEPIDHTKIEALWLSKVEAANDSPTGFAAPAELALILYPLLDWVWYRYGASLATGLVDAYVERTPARSQYPEELRLELETLLRRRLNQLALVPDEVRKALQRTLPKLSDAARTNSSDPGELSVLLLRVVQETADEINEELPPDGDYPGEVFMVSFMRQAWEGSLHAAMSWHPERERLVSELMQNAEDRGLFQMVEDVELAAQRAADDSRDMIDEQAGSDLAARLSTINSWCDYLTREFDGFVSASERGEQAPPNPVAIERMRRMLWEWAVSEYLSQKTRSWSPEDIRNGVLKIIEVHEARGFNTGQAPLR